LNVVQSYWFNPDINSIQIFGKDIRTLLTVICQKIFFESKHSYYNYGPIEISKSGMDLQIGSDANVLPYVSTEKDGHRHTVVVTDRVYEYQHLKNIVTQVCSRGVDPNNPNTRAHLKSDDQILNLCLLSLMLDLGLFSELKGCLNLPFLRSLKHGSDTRELQVEISNLISEFDKANKDSVSRIQVEAMIFEASYKFMVNKNFSVYSDEFKLLNQLNSDPVYHRYLMLVKIYISLCQINKSSEVDYYKIRCNKDFRIVIPLSFSKATSDYLDFVTKRHNFSERDGFIFYDNLPLFDLRPQQPDIHLFKMRFDAGGPVQSMVKYIEISNMFKACNLDAKGPISSSTDSTNQAYIFFIADTTLMVEISSRGALTLKINQIPIEIATIFFNPAISFVPCFKYVDSQDVILFTSKNLHYLVDSGGQFNENYYGMKHNLIECISSEEIYVDLND